jgi:pSer/pThr/pTyr-binding forkhead associated (FHA) protein
MDRIPFLVGVEGILAGRRFQVTVAGLRLGRDPENEVHIDDSGVSRQHARVLLHNGAVWVQDAGSRNGIFVNGNRVPDHKQVKEGDRIVLGAHTFTVELTGTVEKTEPLNPAKSEQPPVQAARSPALPVAVVGAGILLLVACAGLGSAVWWALGQ